MLYKFEASDAAGHSSSIVDLFESMRSPIDFLKELEWVDEYQEARFFTVLSKVSYLNQARFNLLSYMFPDHQQSHRTVLPERRGVIHDRDVSTAD